MTGPQPDPSAVRTVAEFTHLLSLLRLWAGNPSFEELRRRTGLPSSTLSDAVRANRARLPKVEVVRRFVVACGGSGTDLACWESAWRTLAAAPARTDGGPYQVPPSRVRLVGRTAALDRLDELRLSAPVVAIVGMPGVGKTALALEWANRVRDAFDGQLFANMDDPAADVLPSFLHGLGVAPRDVPADPAARLGAYRSLSHGRRLLVVLDGARGAEQVRPLLPGGPASLALVTSRDLLSGLVVRDGAHRLSLGPPVSADAEALVPGDRLAARDLARLCGNLPLALRVALTRLADHPHWTLAEYVCALSHGDVLDELAVPGESVRAAFDDSYAALDAETRALFIALGSAPCADITVPDAAALAALHRAEAARLLGVLRAAHLLEPTGKDRYTLHPLVLSYAADLARAARPGENTLATSRPRAAALTSTSPSTRSGGDLHLEGSFDVVCGSEYGTGEVLRVQGVRSADDTEDTDHVAVRSVNASGDAAVAEHGLFAFGGYPVVIDRAGGGDQLGPGSDGGGGQPWYRLWV